MTSSQSSQPFADYQGGLLAAVTDVAENSLFTFADASDEAAFDAAAPGLGTGWVQAQIHFAGSTSGEFILTVPVVLAQRLGAAFAGADTADEIGEGELVDFTGELANMICGAWLTKACPQEAFDLAPPTVVRGSAACAVAGAGRMYLMVEDTPVRLEIAWGTRNAAGAPMEPERTDGR